MAYKNEISLAAISLKAGTVLFVRFFFYFNFFYSNIVVFTVCCFPCYLMAFDCQELKGLLIYLLTDSEVIQLVLVKTSGREVRQPGNIHITMMVVC